MPLNETFTEIIAKLTARIDELKAQIGEVDTRSTTAYNTSVSLADAIKAQAQALANLQTQVEALQTQVDNLTLIIDSYQAGNTEMFDNLSRLYNDLANTRSVTITTPPTADGTGLPAFVVLDTKPKTEYNNYVYIYPRD